MSNEVMGLVLTVFAVNFLLNVLNWWWSSNQKDDLMTRIQSLEILIIEDRNRLDTINKNLTEARDTLAGHVDSHTEAIGLLARRTS